MSIVSIRGAITANSNSREEILQATEEMLENMIRANEINHEEIIQIHFSATKDLDAVYPAVAARGKLGITDASLMCFQEFYVEGSLAQCIRADMLVNKEGLNKKNVKHQYLRDASRLRPDLIK